MWVPEAAAAASGGEGKASGGGPGGPCCGGVVIVRSAWGMVEERWTSINTERGKGRKERERKGRRDEGGYTLLYSTTPLHSTLLHNQQYVCQPGNGA